MTEPHIMRTNIINQHIIAIKLRRFKRWTRVTCTVEGTRDDWDICGKIRYTKRFDIYDEDLRRPEVDKMWSIAEGELGLDEAKKWPAAPEVR